LSIINPKNVTHRNILHSAKASVFDESSFNPYDLSSDDEEYLTCKSMAEMTPGQSDYAAR